MDEWVAGGASDETPTEWQIEGSVGRERGWRVPTFQRSRRVHHDGRRLARDATDTGPLPCPACHPTCSSKE